MYGAGDVPCLEVSANRMGIGVAAAGPGAQILVCPGSGADGGLSACWCAQTPRWLLGVGPCHRCVGEGEIRAGCAGRVSNSWSKSRAAKGMLGSLVSICAPPGTSWEAFPAGTMPDCHD